jgi:hypothetical protein
MNTEISVLVVKMSVLSSPVSHNFFSADDGGGDGLSLVAFSPPFIE